MQPPIVIQLSAGALVNAASFGTGAVSPGLIVTVFGTGFGPAALSTYELTPDRSAFTRTLADTRVLFDGNSAPMIYASASQLSAVVPYGVAGKPSTEVQVEYLGVKSNTITVAVQPVSPAIFTLNANGRGQGAVINQDYVVNSASTPARRGSIIQIFATGEGETAPGGTDGKLAAASLPRPVAPVRVTIGGIGAEVQYAGAAPGLVAGLVQINARVPTELAPSASTPVVIEIGGKESPAGVTIAVQ